MLQPIIKTYLNKNPFNCNWETLIGDIMDKRFSDTGTKESLFNAGIAKLQRIHFLKSACHTARFQNNMRAWYEALMSIRSELNERLEKDEKKKVIKSQQDIDKHFQDKNYPKKTPTKLYNSLYEHELILGEYEYKYGLGMPDKDEDEEGL